MQSRESMLLSFDATLLLALALVLAATGPSPLGTIWGC